MEGFKKLKGQLILEKAPDYPGEVLWATVYNMARDIFGNDAAQEYLGTPGGEGASGIKIVFGGESWHREDDFGFFMRKLAEEDYLPGMITANGYVSFSDTYGRPGAYEVRDGVMTALSGEEAVLRGAGTDGLVRELSRRWEETLPPAEKQRVVEQMAALFGSRENGGAKKAFVTIRVDGRYVTEVDMGKTVDETIARAESKFMHVDLGGLDVVESEAVMIEDADGNYIWEK